MNNEIVFKQFFGEELDELKSLIHFTVKECYPLCYAPEVINFFLEYHSNDELLRKAREGTILIASKNNNIIASGYLVEQELGGVYIHPNFQKQGIGKQMVDKLLLFAKDKKLEYVWLDSTPFALELYKKFGFKVVEEKVMYVAGDVPLDYYCMRKEL